jgi:AmmeMemoRadiSam system protein A
LTTSLPPDDAVKLLSLQQGQTLVAIARQTLEAHTGRGKAGKPKTAGWLAEPRGVFCTLNTHPSGDLRGCVGFPYPDRPLGEAVVAAAISASRDPRFPPLRADELDAVTVEVSILTVPAEVRVASHADYPVVVRPRIDGLILRYGPRTGLFLPQVWDDLPTPEDFLGALCHKAGLARTDAWMDPEARLYQFQAQIFAERTPKGEVSEVKH